jgi:hypothetical protein
LTSNIGYGDIMIGFFFTFFKRIVYLSLKSTCDVNLLSKLSIIFKEWRVMNNGERGGARV